MSEIQSILLSWLEKATKNDKLHLQDLRDSKLWLQLVKPIKKFPKTQLLQQADWQKKYANFKKIYQSIQKYYKQVLNSSFPMGLPAVNLLQISKGTDKQGLITLLTIFFIACINSQANEFYVQCIVQLSQNQQKGLMDLVKDKSLGILQAENLIQNKQQAMQEIQRSKIDDYLFKIQSLAAQNQSLNSQLTAQTQQKTKLKQQIKKLQQECKRIKRQLDQKMLYIHQKQQQQQQQQSTNRTLSDSNQQIIIMLRKQLVEQQQQHLQQKKKNQQQLQSLTQKLTFAQDKIAQLQSQSLVGVISNRKIHHQDCVSVTEHKNLANKMQIKLKNLEQKQTELQREILRSKYQYEELQRKFKKQEKQKQVLKVQVEKASANKGQMISMKDSNRIKVTILESIRNKLKQKLQMDKNQVM